MPHEVDNEEQLFAEALADKMHEETIISLKGVATAMNGFASALNKLQKDDQPIIDAIKAQPAEIKKAFNEAIKQLPSPQVKVENNTKEFVTLVEEVLNKAVERIELSNDKVVEAINNRPIVDSFDIKPGYNINDRTVKVNYKEDYLNKKSKYQA